MGRIFGTDGIRGIAVTEVTCELAMQVSRAFAHLLREKKKGSPHILVGTDTRLSSAVLEAAACAGVCSAGGDSYKAGTIPVPAAAFLVQKHHLDGAIMLSAFRGGMEYGGLRLFTADGFPVSEDMENAIEALVLEHPEHIQLADGKKVGRMCLIQDPLESYKDFLVKASQMSLDGLCIALDCANGSTSAMAEELFTSLGAKVLVINNETDGTHINDGCGATHIEGLMDFVQEQQCDCGIAFDSDGTRCLGVDETGEMVDGDKLLAIFAKNMKEKGTLSRDTVVVTILSNLGFRSFAEKNGIRQVSANAGERYILEKLADDGSSLGGEQSGCILFPKEFPISDGQRTAMRLLEILACSGKKLSELSLIMEKFPKVMVNVRIPEAKRENWKNDDVITGLIEKHEAQLGDGGRLLVRESSADALIHVMIEGRDFKHINAMAMEISETIRSRVGILRGRNG